VRCPAAQPVGVDAKCSGTCSNGSAPAIRETSVGDDRDGLRCRARCVNATARVRGRISCGPDSEEPPAGEACTWGSTAVCATYTGPDGATITLGPRGAVMEQNVGGDFPVPIEASDNESMCSAFLDALAEAPAITAQWKDLGSLRLDLYTVYRPGSFVDGERLPIVVWANGTCWQPEAYGSVLRHLASYGFFVIAPNSRFTGSGSALSLAMDFAAAADADPSSPYYHRLDTSRIGVMGHSQGGAGTIAIAGDARVSTVAVLNGGSSAVKPFLTMSADLDLGTSVATLRQAVDAAPEAAFVFFHQVPQTGGIIPGHLTVMLHPERVVDITSGWWRYMLQDDAAARSLFVGTSCGLCNRDAELEYGSHGLQ
jgi:hypothetical protein